MNVTNPTPRLTQICSQADHLKVLISQMDLKIKSPSLAAYPQLGAHYTGLMGPVSNKRILSGAYSNSTSNEATTANKVLDRGTCQNHTILRSRIS